MLKILLIIPSRISQNFHLLFCFILVSSLLFQAKVSVASHLAFKMLIYVVLSELINGHK